jgi:hypothetical protein
LVDEEKSSLVAYQTINDTTDFDVAIPALLEVKVTIEDTAL